MAHDVFISYSSKDKATADAACAVLESMAGIKRGKTKSRRKRVASAR